MSSQHQQHHHDGDRQARGAPPPSPPAAAAAAAGTAVVVRRRSTVRQVTTDATRRMVCGGLAGMIAKTATNPLERIKMLSQTGEHSLGGANARASASSARPSVVGLYRDIIKNEGIRGLWAGNGVNLLRVFPAKAVVFSSNDAYRHLFSRLSMPSSSSTAGHRFSASPPPLSAGMSFLAGGCAGMTASAVTYPLDFARGRISGKLGIGGQKAYGGIVQTIVLTVKDEGFLALYKGVTPTLMGAMPYEGIKFGTVGMLETMFPVSPEHNTGKPDPLRKMLFGGLGGVMAGFITYPNDTVRRLLQLQGSRGTNTSYSGYWDCVRQTYREHGITRFYRGLTINVVRMAPNAAVQFGAYELLKNWTSSWQP